MHKNNIMEVNKAAWEKLRKQIEYHTEQDSDITDVHINYNKTKIPYSKGRQKKWNEYALK